MKKQKGVTIIGVLIGITILSIALAAQINLLGNTIRREADLRNMIVATNLAREGIEIAFSWRVSEGWAILKSEDWLGKELCADIRLETKKSGCSTTKKLNPVTYPGYGSEFKTFLYDINPEENLNTPPFWRTIKIENCKDEPTDVCLILKSKVGWDSDKNIEITKKIYNWYVQ